MKKTTFVALLILSTQCFAENLQDSLNNIESEWAKTYYGASAQQSESYQHLLDQTMRLVQQYPNNAGPLYWQAVVKASYADHQDAVAALDAINDARALLNKAIAIDPKTMNGSAYVVLGTLYYMVPEWPIAFGDEEEANKLLQAALKINPNGIDTNYFYGDFLLSNNNIKEAEVYFEKAVIAPIRDEQMYADSQLKEQAKIALKSIKERKVNLSKNLFSLFNSLSAK